MQVNGICNEAAAADPPRTPLREEASANENPSENNDNAEDNEATGNEDEEDSACVTSGGFTGNGQSLESGTPISILRQK